MSTDLMSMPAGMVIRPGMESMKKIEQLAIFTCTHGMVRSSIKEAFKLRTWTTGKTVDMADWNCRIMVRPNGRGSGFKGYSVLLWTGKVQIPQEFLLKEDWRIDYLTIYEIVTYVMDSYLKAKGLQ